MVLPRFSRVFGHLEQVGQGEIKDGEQEDEHGAETDHFEIGAAITGQSPPEWPIIGLSQLAFFEITVISVHVSYPELSAVRFQVSAMRMAHMHSKAIREVGREEMPGNSSI